jgi:dihydropyrimidinase
VIDLVIRGGLAVWPELALETDIAVDAGRIVGLGAYRRCPEARRVVDATGCYVIPGGIDPHVHINWPFLTETTADDFEQATIAAAIGGTTAIIDFAHPRMGSSLQARVAARRSHAENRAVIDYGLHCVVSNSAATTIDEMEMVVAGGISSFKVYMTYSRRNIMLDDAALLRVMRKASSLGATVCVHAENGNLVDAAEADFVTAGRTGSVDFPLHKPNYVEAEAVSRAIFFARQTGARLYVLHLSTAEGLGIVSQARSDGVEVVAETCPQYLLLSDEVYQREEDGHRFICSPPIRSHTDCEALWSGISNRTISVVGTDHCLFTSAQKDKGRHDFTQVPNGLPGIETRLSLIYSEGVAKGRISINDLVRVTSHEPAVVFGLFPAKGTLTPGSDADIVVLDPTSEQKLSPAALSMGSDWTPYEGWELTGSPVTTIAAGEVIVEHGNFVGRPGRGRFLVRATPQLNHLSNQ